MKYYSNTYPYLAPNRLSERSALFLAEHNIVYSVPHSHRLSLQLKIYESACLVMNIESALLVLYDPFWNDKSAFLSELYSHIRALKIAMIGESLQEAAVNGDMEAHRLLIELSE